MYIYKIVTTFLDGPQTQWVCDQQGETIADTKRRVEDMVDTLAQRKDVVSVRMSRRTLPGI